MKGLLYKDISIMTRSFKGNILLLMALGVQIQAQYFLFMTRAKRREK